MNTKKGSAILMVLAVIAVLLIISTFVIQNKTQRAAFTRYMSNEKKVEAVAEAVLDMTIAKIRIEANEHSSTFYEFLRSECSTVNGKLNNGGKNSVMNAPTKIQSIDPSYFKSAFDAITSGDPGNFSEPVVSAQIIHAEAFGEKEDSYEVVGITIPPKTSSAKGSGTFPNSDASPNKDWRLPLLYPPYKDGADNFENVWNDLPQNDIESGFAYKSPDITVKLNFKGLLANAVALIGGLDDELDINLLLKHAASEIGSRTAIEFGIKIEDEFIDKVNDLIDDYNDIPLVPNIDYHLTTESVNELIKESMAGENTIDIEALLFEKMTEFDLLKTQLSQPQLSPKSLQKLAMGENVSPNYSNTTAGSLPATFIEKGALLQLTCVVEYTPVSSQAKLNKTFKAEIPFKASDVQPIAPEYTFFIANSKLLGNPAGKTLPLNIDFNCTEGGTEMAVDDEFMLHNMNHEQTVGEKDTISYDKVNALTPPAGKIRVNGSEIKPVFLFAGTLNDGIKSSELTALALSEQSDSSRALQLKATFGWYQTMSSAEMLTKQVKIHFPILRTSLAIDEEPAFQTAIEKGIAGIYYMYKQKNFGDIFTKPSLLYGYGHLDYPLGNKIEGKVGSVVSEVFGVVEVDDKIEIDIKIDLGGIEVNPHDDPWDKEVQTYFGITNIKTYPNGGLIPYGLPNISQYNTIDETWANTNEKGIMPSNCYSLLQYQKKATSYFVDGAVFMQELKDKDYNIDGVNYIEGNLNLSGNHTFSGNGLIVADNIEITGSTIQLADSDSSLGIIARSGSLAITDSVVYAGCFSNDAPIFTNSTIYGNLVMNAFEREKIFDCHIRYAPKYMTVKDTKFSNEDKANPYRYYVSFAENWSKSYYEKK
ncbi:MAG: hypothetical protein WDA26_12005 [Pusillimonas sp.]